MGIRRRVVVWILGSSFRLSAGKLYVKTLFLQFALNGFPMITLNDNGPVFDGTTGATKGFESLTNLFKVIGSWLKP